MPYPPSRPPSGSGRFSRILGRGVRLFKLSLSKLVSSSSPSSPLCIFRCSAAFQSHQLRPLRPSTLGLVLCSQLVLVEMVGCAASPSCDPLLSCRLGREEKLCCEAGLSRRSASPTGSSSPFLSSCGLPPPALVPSTPSMLHTVSLWV
ncbi:hypothetical protein Hamer_G025222 [Homarus americanus]|uniref:Uncharacterized protein n=1 Tax=Homarus americanus TaxID=6706 RepID=A0A8J5MY44_HOMAM|nr:hypothetical protein Hamer_G025222 [Homarus americanus]